MYSKLVFLLFILNFVFLDLEAQPVIRGAHQIDTLANSYASASDEKRNKPSVSVALGSTFSTNGRYSGVGTYIAPEVSMPVSKRLSLSFGMSYSSMFFNAPGGQSVSNSYGSVFVSGAYQVNENLVVRGTAYKSFLLNPTPETRGLNSQFMDFSNQGFMLDAEYQVNEKFRIGVSVQYMDQNQPSLCPSGNNSFGSSPFQSGPNPLGFN